MDMYSNTPYHPQRSYISHVSFRIVQWSHFKRNQWWNVCYELQPNLRSTLIICVFPKLPTSLVYKNEYQNNISNMFHLLYGSETLLNLNKQNNCAILSTSNSVYENDQHLDFVCTEIFCSLPSYCGMAHGTSLSKAFSDKC